MDKRTLVTGKELYFEDLQEGNNLLLKQVPGGFITSKKKSSTENSQKVMDRFIFNSLAVDNAGQPADNKHTGSAETFSNFFLLASKTNKPFER